VLLQNALLGIILFLCSLLALAGITFCNLLSATVVILVNADPGGFFFFALCCSDKNLPLPQTFLSRSSSDEAECPIHLFLFLFLLSFHCMGAQHQIP